MTDPERISQRASGLAAQLLQAGGEEQPGSSGVERTLAALGISGAALTTAAMATAGVGGAAAGAGAATKTVTATLLAKWVGVGVLGGVVLSGAAAVVSGPAAAPPSNAPLVVKSAAVGRSPGPSVVAPVVAPPVDTQPVPEPVPVHVTPSARASPATTAPDETPLEVGAPLAEEVAFIDAARALLRSGQAEQGLLRLSLYEREFPEARLLPEVLFLRMETNERLGRSDEALTAATRLVQGFPRSPHAARARQLLGR